MPMLEGLPYEVHRAGKFLVVEVCGVLDEHSVSHLRRTLTELYEVKDVSVVLDMSRVPLVDSEGFGTLIHIQKRLTEMGRKLILVGCQEAVRLALSLTRLEMLFPNYPSLQQIPA